MHDDLPQQGQEVVEHFLDGRQPLRVGASSLAGGNEQICNASKNDEFVGIAEGSLECLDDLRVVPGTNDVQVLGLEPETSIVTADIRVTNDEKIFRHC